LFHVDGIISAHSVRETTAQDEGGSGKKEKGRRERERKP
jgi:hypothetical protein